MHSWRELALGLMLVLGMPGCSDDGAGGADTDGTTGDTDGGSGGKAGPWEELSERPCPPDSFLTYENFGGPFVLNYCTGCHSSGVPADMRQEAPAGINFDDIDDIRTHAPRMWLRAAAESLPPFDVPTMPPAGHPPAAERLLLGEWLACGAPTNAELGL